MTPCRVAQQVLLSGTPLCGGREDLGGGSSRGSCNSAGQGRADQGPLSNLLWNTSVGRPQPRHQIQILFSFCEKSINISSTPDIYRSGFFHNALQGLFHLALAKVSLVLSRQIHLHQDLLATFMSCFEGALLCSTIFYYFIISHICSSSNQKSHL